MFKKRQQRELEDMRKRTEGKILCADVVLPLQASIRSLPSLVSYSEKKSSLFDLIHSKKEISIGWTIDNVSLPI